MPNLHLSPSIACLMTTFFPGCLHALLSNIMLQYWSDVQAWQSRESRGRPCCSFLLGSIHGDTCRTQATPLCTTMPDPLSVTGSVVGIISLVVTPYSRPGLHADRVERSEPRYSSPALSVVTGSSRHPELPVPGAKHQTL